MFGGGTSKAGADVSEDTAVKVTAVFACIRLLSQTIASLPLHTYRRLEDGKEKAYDHPLYNVLHDLWNPECTSYQGRLIMMVNILLTGHGFAEIVRDRGGRIIELWPIPTGRVMIKRNKQTGEIVYDVFPEDGSLVRLYPDQMYHIQWIGLENFKTFYPVRLAREAIGLSIAAEEFGSRFFESGANASGIAEYPGKLSEEAYERFKKSFNEKYTGLDKNQRVMFLEEGLKFTKLTINPNEAQAIETRRFQVEEIARFYNVPLHLIQEHEKNTSWGTGIEEMNLGFVMFSLRPYLVCWEQEAQRSLFSNTERRRFFIEFNVDGLLRGDAKSRAEALDIQMRNGVINADEWRALENMNPQPDGLGKIYYVPLNWVPKHQQEEIIEDQNGRQAVGLLEKRSAPQEKLKLANNYMRIFQDAASRVVKREAKDIRRKAKSALGERSEEDFLIWLEQYYDEAPTWMKRTMMPALLSYAEQVQGVAAGQLGVDEGMTPELEEWMDGYADIWARNYIMSSRGQIEAIIREANEQGVNPEEAINERLDEWESKRPNKVARNETVEALGVVSKFVFIGAGVTRLRWNNASGSPCSFCEELHGKVVGIDQPFVGKNDKLEAEDQDQSMLVRKPTFTPPVHQNCMCVIEPSQ